MDRAVLGTAEGAADSNSNSNNSCNSWLSGVTSFFVSDEDRHVLHARKTHLSLSVGNGAAFFSALFGL
eukprot:6202804-Alexandrium_andersonii.AAC.1